MLLETRSPISVSRTGPALVVGEGGSLPRISFISCRIPSISCRTFPMNPLSRFRSLFTSSYQLPNLNTNAIAANPGVIDMLIAHCAEFMGAPPVFSYRSPVRHGLYGVSQFGDSMHCQHFTGNPDPGALWVVQGCSRKTRNAALAREGKGPKQPVGPAGCFGRND